MKLTTCINNHFYDSDKYASCPYCAKAENGTGDLVTEALRPQASLRKPERERTETLAAPKQESELRPQATAPAAQASPNIPTATEAFSSETAPEPAEATPVVPEASGSAGNPAPAPATGFTANRVEEAAESVPQISSYGRHQPESAPVRSQAVNTAVHGWANQTADDDEDENCTVGYYAQVLGVEPVVGWLVCIRGAYRGESFRLKSGRNFIGRAANMDIVLGADQSVSRLRHAAVVYDPRSRAFIVAAGDARELCYLNGEVVITSNIMKAYDVLSLGNTDLMLMPLCGEHFTWDAEPGREIQ